MMNAGLWGPLACPPRRSLPRRRRLHPRHLPIVRRHDEAAFGHYRTKAMILAYFNALAAGDTTTDVAV